MVGRGRSRQGPPSVVRGGPVILPSWLPTFVATSRFRGLHLARGWQVGADRSIRFLMFAHGTCHARSRYVLPCPSRQGDERPSTCQAAHRGSLEVLAIKWSCLRATASKEVFCQSDSDFVTRVRCRIYVCRGHRRVHNTLDVGREKARK